MAAVLKSLAQKIAAGRSPLERRMGYRGRDQFSHATQLSVPDSVGPNHGLHSSTFRVHVSTFRGRRRVIAGFQYQKKIQLELRSGRV